MQSNLSRSDGKWVDYRFFIWVAPLSSMAILWMTGIIGVSIYFIYTEDFGDNVSKKITLLVMASIFLLIGLYVCIGIYQLFFHEFRRKFIARKVERRQDEIQVRGYYFKELRFKDGDVATIEEHVVKPRFGKNIATFLSYTCPNYKVTLKDGREFYLPGEMTDVDELKALLARK